MAEAMSSRGDRFRLGGLIAAPFTPMDQRGINLPVIERQAQSLVQGGVKGAFICGSTGEGASLTTAERMAVAEKWISAAAGELNIPSCVDVER